MSKTKMILLTVVVILVLLISGMLLLFKHGGKVNYMSNLKNSAVVQPISLGFYNIYLIKSDVGYILVDTGMPDSEKKLDEALSYAGVDPKDIHLIILTHAHLDHVGQVVYAKQITNAKILCHKDVAENLKKGKSEPAIARNSFASFLNFISGNTFKPIQPDIIMDQELDLKNFGVKGKIIHTPGHSQGSVSIILDKGETLVGDMIRDENDGKIGIGMFYEDKQVLKESLKKVARYNSERIYLSHGTWINNGTLQNAIEQLSL